MFREGLLPMKSSYKLLPPETTYQCIYVCKLWSFAAIQTYYHNLRLNGDMINLLQVALNLDAKNKNSIMTVRQNGEYVKSLILYNDSKQMERLDKAQLIILLSTMPHLKEINVSSSSRTTHYLKCLWDVVKMSSYSKEKIIKGIEEVGISSFRHMMKPQYIQVCYAFRDTLTHLCLGRPEQAYIDHERYYGTNLTHLHIKNETTYDINPGRHFWDHGYTIAHYSESNVSIQSVLNACSKLTHLKLESDV